MHLVHWNTKYPSPNVAAGEPDGLAVLGLLIEVGQSPHDELEKVVKTLAMIKNKNEKVTFKDNKISPANFLPNDKRANFWTYDGSLTTPPLLESVTWIIFQEPIQMSEAQVSF
jgi:carbonic anhydrase